MRDIRTKYILQEIEEGFKIGLKQFLYSTAVYLSTPNPSIITDYLTKEVFLNRMCEYPLNAAPREIHISPVGAIPKKHKLSKYWLIMDFSTLELMMVLIQHHHPYPMYPLIIYYL